MNRVPRLWRSAMLGFPLIPSPAGLGSRLASGPYGPASFGPERIGLPASLLQIHPCHRPPPGPVVEAVIAPDV